MFNKEKRLLNQQDLIRANIPDRYWSSSYDQIPDDCKYKKFLSRYLESIKDYSKKGEGLLFFGHYGTGKTSAGVIILKEVISWGLSCYFATIQEFRDNIHPGNTTKMYIDNFSEYTILERYANVDYLLIDDLGAEKSITDLLKREFESLIRQRYNKKRPTIITSNIIPEPKGSNSDNMLSIKDIYGEGVFSVIKESQKFTLVSGKNWRDTS